MARFPMPRFTMRRIMFVVAMVAISLGPVAWLSTYRKYENRANYHVDQYPFNIGIGTPEAKVRADYHARMAVKWREASISFWQSVEPDPE